MSGEISMAPMITAVELTFSPTEATRMAKTRAQVELPWNSTSTRICLIAPS